MPDLDIQPPLFHGLAGNEYSAARLRRYLQTTLGDLEGVHSYADLRVTPSTPAAMSVQVAPGRGIVNGDEVVRQGAYLLELASALTVPIAANGSGNGRIDLIVLRDYDAAADGGSAGADKGTVEVVQGTPAASPVAPSVPSNAIPLAQVGVASGASSIVAANITERRIPLGLATPVHGYVSRTNAQTASSGIGLLLDTIRRDTFNLARVANRLELLPQEPRAGLWTFNARVTLAQAMASNFALIVTSQGVDHIIGSNVQRGPATESQPVIATSGILETTPNVDPAGRYLQVAISHTEAGTVSVSSVELAATYLGPVS